jgi:hypothetical protein
MTKVKKEIMGMTQAAVNIPGPALPSHQEVKLIQAEINVEVREAVIKEAKRRGVTIKDAIYWGLCTWLYNTNPAEAKRLGIAPGKDLP